MEAVNQFSEFEDENIIDPVIVVVNSGASLSVQQRASIARNRKLPTNKRNDQQRGSAKTTNVSAWERLKEYTQVNTLPQWQENVDVMLAAKSQQQEEFF